MPLLDSSLERGAREAIGNPACSSSHYSNHVEITRFLLVAFVRLNIELRKNLVMLSLLKTKPNIEPEEMMRWTCMFICPHWLEKKKSLGTRVHMYILTMQEKYFCSLAQT